MWLYNDEIIASPNQVICSILKINLSSNSQNKSKFNSQNKSKFNCSKLLSQNTNTQLW